MDKAANPVWRKVVSVVTAFALAFTLCPASALADEASQDAATEPATLNYVSIGDSMANGYGFAGYNQTSKDLNVYDFMTGKGMYGEGAYPLQFEEYLTEQGYDVNHTKLATSAMLAEDLLYLLDGREEFDDGWSGYKDYVGNYSDEELKPYIQEAVTNADVITMGIGNASFGAFMLDRITSALGVFGSSLDEDEKLTFEDAISVLELDDEQYAMATEIYNSLQAELVNKVPAELAEQYNLNDVVGILSYTTVSYVVNYKLLVEKMLEMNPDAEIVLVGLLNTTYGMNITDENGNVLIPFGDVMDSLFGTLNAYMAGLPAVLQAQGVAPEATLYYAEQPEPKFICQEFEALHANGWEAADARLNGDTVRQRNIDAFNGDLRHMIGMAVNGKSLSKISLDDVNAYESLDWDALKAAAGECWNPWAALYFAKYCSPEDAPDKILSVAIYLAIEEAVAKSTNTMDIQLSGLQKIAGDLSTVFSDLGEPPTDSPESTRGWLLDGLTTPEVIGMCKIYGLFKVGNGMSVHPTPAGHDDIAQAVIGAYKNNTVQAETNKNIIEAAEAVADIVAEYYDEAYAYAYGQAKDAGYIDQAVKGLGDVKTYLDQAAEWAKANKGNMSEQLYNDLVKAIENAKVTLDQMQVLINEADVLDQAAFAELMNLVEKLNQNLADVAALMNTAGSDLGAEAYEVYVNDVKPVLEQVAQDTYEFLAEKADEAYKAFVEAAKWAANELPGKAADAIYNYLLNNPEEVIAFITTYGPDFVEFLQEYQEPILLVLGWLVQNYGDDVLEYVIDNGDEILAGMVYLYEEHGENAWKLIKVYADALGVTAAVEQQIAILEGQIADLKAQLEDALAQMDQEMADAIRAQIAYIEAQIAQLEGLLDQLDAAILQGKAQVDAVIAEVNRIMAEINQLIADIQAAIEKLDAQVRDLNAKVEQLIADIQKTVAEIQAKVDAFIGALEDLPENADEALRQVLDFVAKQFGEDVANYLQKNSEQLLEYMVLLVQNYGDEAWDMVKVLVDASGIEDYLKAKADDALTGTYRLTDDSYYLALGDSNAYGAGLGKKESSYAELLAAELKLSEEQFSDLTVEGLRTQDLRAILDPEFKTDAYGEANFADLIDQRDAFVSEIEKADLITLSIGADDLSTFVSDQLLAKVMGKKVAEMDWAAMVGEEYVEKVDQILVDVNAYFQENGLDAETAELLTFVVECYAYGYFGFTYNYAEVTNDILAINPDAQVVLVGMFNAIDGMNIELPSGETFAFGEYVDHFVALTDVQFVTYASMNKNVTYVPVHETEVFFDENVDPTTTQYLLELFVNKASELRPNAAGHKYIQEQILNGVTVVKSLEDAKVAVKDVVYNAKAQKPAVTVTVDGKELAADKDFTVSYKNNVQVGTATAVVEGKGAYYGTVQAEFAIKHFATAASFEDFQADAWYLSEESNRGAFDGQKTLYLDYILATGIMNGYKKDSTTDELTGLFGPNDKLKRADAATILYRVANPDSTDTTVSADYAKNATVLPDVEDDRYYTAAVNWCVEQGIITGYKGDDPRAGKFVPEGKVTREELATMVYRFCTEYAGVEVIAADITSFKDYGRIHAYALDAVAFCNAEKIMSGRINVKTGTRDKIDPRGNATRAEASKMFAVSVRDVAEL